MSQKQELELIQKFIEEIRINYPDLRLGDIQYKSDETWVDILMPDELIGDETIDDILAKKGTDVLLNHGHQILFLPMVA